SGMWCVQLSKLMNVDWATHMKLDAFGYPEGAGISPSNIWICPSDPEQFPLGYAANYPTLITYLPPKAVGRVPYNISKLRRSSEIMVIAEGWSDRTGVLYGMAPIPSIGWNFTPDYDYDGDGQIDSSHTLISYGYPPYNNVGIRH